jgi:V8-like Glu-specific endopeptidase
MWTMSGGITSVNSTRQWYQIDTFGGQSGSPLYHLFDGSDPGTTPECCYGAGIHTYGTSVSPFFGNSATRITQAAFNNLTAWRNAP